MQGTLATYRALLGNRSLTKLLAGEFASSIGDWLYLVALLVVVYRESADPLLLGIVGAARVLPYVVLSVPAGIAADRFDRRMVLLVTDVARGACMLVLAWLVLTDGPLAAIVAVAIVATCFSSFFGPAIGSYIPALVQDERELGPANSAWASLDNLAFIIGPGLAGVLLAVADLSVAFVLNAVSFLVVASVLWTLPPSRGGDGSQTEGAQTGGTGEPSPARPGDVATVRSLLRPLAGLTTLDVVGGFAFGGLGVLTVLLATEQLGAGDEVTGYLNAAIGVGGVVGSVVVGALVLRARLAAPLLGGAALLALGLVVLGATDVLLVALVGMAAAAAGSLVTEVVSTTVFQRTVPDRIRGRALGVMLTISTLAYAAGSLLVPVLSGRFGPLPVLAGCAVAVVGASVVMVVLVGPHLTREPDDASLVLGRVAGLPLFAGVPAAAMEAAVGRLRPREVAAGEVVIRQGDVADVFYLVDTGRFAVDVADGGAAARRVRELGPDEVFGEIGLLRRAPRSATVTALEDGRVLTLEADEFLELVSSGPGLSTRMLEPYGIR